MEAATYSLSTIWEGNIDGGLRKCGRTDFYLRGFVRDVWTVNDPLRHLLIGLCCKREFSPLSRTLQPLVIGVDWRSTFNRQYTWASCPHGYFLNGLYISDVQGGLSSVKEGRCVNPADYPADYGHCYDHDISECFNHRGACSCIATYYVTALYRSHCELLSCLDKLRCCQMAHGPEILDGLDMVKSRIMNTTLEEMSYLASFLGYAYCLGCHDVIEDCGEGFVRIADVWHADTTFGFCGDYKQNQRLNIAYGDWGFEVKDIVFSVPTKQNLHPETIDTGIFTNNSPFKASTSFERSHTSVRRVSHTKTSAWKHGQDLQFSVSYQPDFGGKVRRKLRV